MREERIHRINKMNRQMNETLPVFVCLACCSFANVTRTSLSVPNSAPSNLTQTAEKPAHPVLAAESAAWA